MGINNNTRYPLLEIQEESSNHSNYAMLQHTLPTVTITTSPINANENDQNSKSDNKLPTLTTPPQTVTRSITNAAVVNRSLEADTSFDKGTKFKRLKKTKPTTLLSPAFSSPPTTKMDKSMGLPPPPELPKFVTNTQSKPKLSSKKEKSQEDIDELNRQVPPPELMPKVIDTSTDFTKKPLYSYAMLIGMSILRAPNRRLTLSQIYNWISDTFKYYKKGDVGWQNSVRHNLSLNKAFVKSAKSKDRKGHFWHIAKDYEYQFYLGKGAAASTIALSQKAIRTNSDPILVRDDQSHKRSFPSYNNRNLDDDEATSDEEDNDTEPGIGHDDDDYTDDNDEDETVRIDTMAQTPRSKIIHRQYDDDSDFSITRNSSQLLQRYLLHKRTASQEDNSLQHPAKRRLQPSSAGAGQLAPGNIPNLQPPSPYWSLSASGDRVIFGLLKTPPKMQSHSTNSNTTSQTSIFDSPLQLQAPTHPSSITQNNRYQQFTSSFSCNSNFDLSPIKGTETGPLLEPLTPGQVFSININNNLSSIGNSLALSLNNPSTPSTLKTPFNNKTSLSAMKTPGSSVMKKIWNSPSYLDDFYTSPVVNKGIHFAEEEVVVSSTRLFGSPSKEKKQG